MPTRSRPSLLWSAPLLLLASSLAAQQAPHCLRPPLQPVRVLAGAMPTGASPPKGVGGVYLTAEGRVCGTFVPQPAAFPAGQTSEGRPGRPGAAFLASALLPGAGQWIQGQERWTAYAAAEVWAWIQFLERRREGRRLQRQYRDLAWWVARRVSSGARVDGSFEYYEAMSQYPASGAFDSDPILPGVQPETDPRTFNGTIWALASEIFLPEDSGTSADPGSPAYDRALDYYRSRAYPSNLTWNWGSNSLQQGEYRDLIEASDENLRRSTTMIGLILANHLLSGVDGLITGRLRSTPVDATLQAALLPATPFSEVLTLQVLITLPGGL